MYLQKKHVFSVPQVSHLHKSYTKTILNSTATLYQNFKKIGQEVSEKIAYGHLSAYGHNIFIYIDYLLDMMPFTSSSDRYVSIFCENLLPSLGSPETVPIHTALHPRILHLHENSNL